MKAAHEPISRHMIELKYRLHLYWGKAAGINHVISYLRNPSPSINLRLLRDFGATIGEGSRIKRAVIIDNSYEDEGSCGDLSHLSIGKNCYVGDEVFFDLADRITLRDDVVVSARVSFITHMDCNRSPYLDRVFPAHRAGITVEDGAWIGFGAIILPGVTIGKESAVAAGAVVDTDIESRSLYAGMPARKIREF